SGGAVAIRLLRQQAFDVVITDPETTIDEGLALSEEMRDIRPGMKAILLAPSSTPEEVIAALRARVFLCFSAPFDAYEIASFACRAATDSDWRTEIEVLSAQPDWVSLRANCHILTAERVVTFRRIALRIARTHPRQRNAGVSRDPAQRYGTQCRLQPPQ